MKWLAVAAGLAAIGYTVAPAASDSQPAHPAGRQFCGAGGAAMGYHRAGFEVVGVEAVDWLRRALEQMAQVSEGDPGEVLPPDSRAESQVELNGSSGSPTSPSERVAFVVSTAKTQLHPLGRFAPNLPLNNREGRS